MRNFRGRVARLKAALAPAAPPEERASELERFRAWFWGDIERMTRPQLLAEGEARGAPETEELFDGLTLEEYEANAFEVWKSSELWEPDNGKPRAPLRWRAWYEAHAGRASRETPGRATDVAASDAGDTGATPAPASPEPSRSNL